MNRQSGVGDSKYVVFRDPLLTDHVIRRMRCAEKRLTMGTLTSKLSFIVIVAQQKLYSEYRQRGLANSKICSYFGPLAYRSRDSALTQ